MITMATTQRFDPSTSLRLEGDVHSASDALAFDIHTTDRPHTSILGYLSSALFGLLPCAFAPSVHAAGAYTPASIHHGPSTPSLPLPNMPSPTSRSTSFHPFNVPCMCISVPRPSPAVIPTDDDLPSTPSSPSPAPSSPPVTSLATSQRENFTAHPSDLRTLPGCPAPPVQDEPSQREPHPHYSAQPNFVPSGAAWLTTPVLESQHPTYNDLRTAKVLQAPLPVQDAPAQGSADLVHFDEPADSHGINCSSRLGYARATTHPFSHLHYRFPLCGREPATTTTPPIQPRQTIHCLSISPSTAIWSPVR